MWTIKLLQSTTTHKVTVKIEEEQEDEQEQEQEDFRDSVQQHVNHKNTAIYYHHKVTVKIDEEQEEVEGEQEQEDLLGSVMVMTPVLPK